MVRGGSVMNNNARRLATTPTTSWRGGCSRAFSDWQTLKLSTPPYVADVGIGGGWVLGCVGAPLATTRFLAMSPIDACEEGR